MRTPCQVEEFAKLAGELYKLADNLSNPTFGWDDFCSKYNEIDCTIQSVLHEEAYLYIGKVHKFNKHSYVIPWSRFVKEDASIENVLKTPPIKITTIYKRLPNALYIDLNQFSKFQRENLSMVTIGSNIKSRGAIESFYKISWIVNYPACIKPSL